MVICIRSRFCSHCEKGFRSTKALRDNKTHGATFSFEYVSVHFFTPALTRGVSLYKARVVHMRRNTLGSACASALSSFFLQFKVIMLSVSLVVLGCVMAGAVARPQHHYQPQQVSY